MTEVTNDPQRLLPEPKSQILHSYVAEFLAKEPSFPLDDIEMKESIVYLNELKNLPVFSKVDYTPTPANTPSNKFSVPSIYFLSSMNIPGTCSFTPTPANTPIARRCTTDNLIFIPPAKDLNNNSIMPQMSPDSKLIEQKAELSFNSTHQKIFSNSSPPSNTSDSPDIDSTNPFAQVTSSPEASQNDDTSSPTRRDSSSTITYPLNCDEWSDSLVQDNFLIYGILKLISLHKRLSNPFLEPNSNSRKNAFKLIVIDLETRDEKVAFADCPRDIDMNDKKTDFKAVLHQLIAEQIKKSIEESIQRKAPVIEDVSDGEDSVDGEGFRCYYEERIVRGHEISISVFVDPDDKGFTFRVVPLTDDGEEGYDKFVDKEGLLAQGFLEEGENLLSTNFSCAIDVFICNQQITSYDIQQQVTDFANELTDYPDFETFESDDDENIQPEYQGQEYNQVTPVTHSRSLLNNLKTNIPNVIIPTSPVIYLQPSPSLTKSPRVFNFNSNALVILTLLFAIVAIIIAYVSVSL